jgi:hypothetical protein
MFLFSTIHDVALMIDRERAEVRRRLPALWHPVLVQ